jgi:hypothetical protein
MEYLDFDLEIGPGSGQTYPLALLRSPMGQARGAMAFPFAPAALDTWLKDVQLAVLRSGNVRRRVPAPQEQAVQQFGQRLFGALLAGEIGRLYDASLLQASQRGRGLRLRLRILAPELAGIPWEYLYDTRQGEYICLARSTPVVRDLKSPLALQPLPVKPPLRILGMVASPSDQDPLDIAREQGRLQTALQRAVGRGLVHLKWMSGQNWRDLQREMRGGPWHIFHFIGHGGYDPKGEDGLLALTGEDGKTELLGSTEAGRLIAGHLSLRLVVLNACEGARGSQRDLFSSMATTLARRGVPAVLAMQEEISDDAAIELTRTFYEVLAEGRPVDEAIGEARTAISVSLKHSLEWGTPVLYLRTPTGVLFDLPQLSGSIILPPVDPSERQKLPPQPAPLNPRQPGQQSRKRRVAVRLMGALRVLAGAGIGALAGASVSNFSAVLIVLGVLIGGALGLVVELTEETARKGQEPLARLIMRIFRITFGGSIGVLIASNINKNNAVLVVLGLLIGAAVVFLFGLLEDRARAAGQRALLGFIHTVRTITKGIVGAAGGAAIALIIALLYYSANPITSSRTATSLGDAIGQAIGDAIATVLAAIILGVLGAFIGLVIGLIVGAIVEFSAPPAADKPQG